MTILQIAGIAASVIGFAYLFAFVFAIIFTSLLWAYHKACLWFDLFISSFTETN